MRKPPKLKTLLILPSSALFLLLVAILTGAAFFIYSSNVRDSSYRQMEATSEQVLRNYETYFASAVQVSDGIYARYSDLAPDDVASLPSYFDTIIELKPEIISVSIYSADGGKPLAKNTSSSFSINAAEQEWFLRAIADPYINVFSQGASSEAVPYSFVLSRLLVSDVDGGRDAVARIGFDFTQIVETISPVSLGEGGRFIIYDRDYETIYASNSHELEQALSYVKELVVGSTTIYFGGHNYYLYSMTISNTTWRVAILTNIDSITTAISTFAIAVSATAIVMVVIFVVIVVLVANRITRPIRLLQREMSRVEGLAYESYLATGNAGSREVADLSHSFENMMKRIRQLMDDVVKEKEEQRRSELKALQNQINPHFLYNTLDSIIALIDRGEGEKAQRMVVALSRFFRISISRGHNIIPLKDEIEHARNYLLIQKMRFGDSFDFRIEKEEGLDGLYVVKLILQPIIENSIAHGMKEGEPGSILIKAFKDEKFLYLAVQDNGYGMLKDKLEALDASMRSRESYQGVGLKNVYERLRVYYGEEADVVIESEPDVGTKVTLVIPLKGAVQNEGK